MIALIDQLARSVEPSVEMPETQRLRSVPKAFLQAQLDALESADAEPVVEPLRTIHHFACTGGTLISKCIASLPNIQLLSEVDPLSEMHLNPQYPTFSPRDMITQMLQSTRGTNDEVLVLLFQQSIKIAHGQAVKVGKRLVIRDHAHSHFCIGSAVPTRKSCRDLLPPELPVLSLLTVRHPVESYSSLLSNGWASFLPAGIDEYCRRYCLFLDSYCDVPIERYEDFVAEPVAAMSRMSEALRLPKSSDFIEVFPLFKITGDSGRRGEVIGPRPARPISQSLQREIEASPHYLPLVERLGYQPEPIGLRH